MTAAEYLRAILDEQTLDPDGEDARALAVEQERVATTISDALDESSPGIEAGGSRAKGTLIRAAYDLDLVCYFRHEDTGAGDTLKEIYESVQAALSAEYEVEPKRSAIRMTRPANGGPELPFAVDVVPGRFVDETEGDVFLFQHEGEKDRLKTNLKKHAEHVRNSGCVDVVRLAKLWKHRAGVDIKTFVLELLVVELLDGHRDDPHDTNLKRFWNALRDNTDEIQVEDPANPTGNDLSGIFGEVEREALSAAASVTLDALDAGGWEAVFGALEEDVGQPSAKLVDLADHHHRRDPPWPARRTIYKVELACTYRTRRGSWSPTLQSGKVLVTDDVSLRYRASTTVPPPYEVFWQVVNTGAHATEKHGLRGEEFLPARKQDRSPSPNPLETWERSEYTGRHWIECFIVKGGELWARSGPFYVDIINRQRRGYVGWIKAARRRWRSR